jgi:DNA-binding MarR family transcriptional regulator
MGIPSCLLIKPEYEALVGEISGIVGITPHTIEDELARLIQDESLRVKLGDAGKRYVKRVHDNEIITAQIERIYNFI